MEARHLVQYKDNHCRGCSSFNTFSLYFKKIYISGIFIAKAWIKILIEITIYLRGHRQQQAIAMPRIYTHVTACLLFCLSVELKKENNVEKLKKKNVYKQTMHTNGQCRRLTTLRTTKAKQQKNNKTQKVSNQKRPEAPKILANNTNRSSSTGSKLNTKYFKTATTKQCLCCFCLVSYDASLLL